jgi:NAD(P)-dependent dehydrogenase (short-subunit alcohol dehydrogenase family)
VAALVTGATRGIGLALVRALAARGEAVTGTFRSRPPPDAPEGSDWLRLELRDPASIAALAAAWGERPLDLLVLNAGIYPDRPAAGEPLGGSPPEAWAEGFAVNVTGAFLTVQALLPALRRARGARIAILGSRMGSTARAPGGSYIYRASKAAVLNLGRNLATDLRGFGIAVGIYHPGWVRTDMGGPGAEIDPSEAAAGLLARFDALGPETSGCFEDWQGRPIPF